MVTRTRKRIGRSGIAVLLVMTSLLVQGSVRADTPLTPRQQNSINRATISLLQQGKNLVDVLDFMVKVEDCQHDKTLCNDAMFNAGEKVGLRRDRITEDFDSLALLSGFWTVYEGFTNTTGRITVGPSSPGDLNTFKGTAKFSPSGTADFTFDRDDNNDFDFRYTNNLGDAGTGYLLWTPSGCTLVGFFFSTKFKDDGVNFNSATLVFRRC